MAIRYSIANLSQRIYSPVYPAFTPVLLDDAAKTSLTGTEVDDKFAAQIIGKDIPIFVGGQALIGCRIAEGPFINTVDGAGYVDMIVTAALAATPTATREIRSIRLNGTESLTSADGGATWTGVGTAFDAVEVNVLYGTEEQTPLASSIARYGARAVPYRSHICVELKNVPLSVFANIIPFVSIEVYESDFLTRNDGILKLAQYARYDTSELEVEVSGQDEFWIVAQQSTFIAYLQGLQRTVGRNWNIAPSDKLRVFENDTTVTPIAITRADIVEDSASFQQIDPNALPAIRNLGFIDTGRDNDFNKVKAVRARFPIALTSSQDREDLDIPIGMDAAQATSIVNRSLLIDQFARDRFSCNLLPHMRHVQPGDLIAPDVDDEIDFPVGRVLSAVRNSADWTIEITAERISLALLETAPSITSNGGGATASITVDEEDGVSVTTVTATNADATDAFSIIGGADAALFTINADTGVLTFLTEPDFEDPQDADSNNTYVVIVQALGNGLTDSQTITVTVADVVEGGESGSPMGLLLALTYS